MKFLEKFSEIIHVKYLMYRWGLKRYKFFNKPNVLQEQRCKCKETHESVSNPMFTKTQDTLGVLANISEWFTSSG